MVGGTRGEGGVRGGEDAVHDLSRPAFSHDVSSTQAAGTVRTKKGHWKAHMETSLIAETLRPLRVTESLYLSDLVTLDR